MKRLGLGALYELGLLVIVFGIVVHAPITVGLGSIWPEYMDGIKAWKELLLGLLAVAAALLLTKHHLWGRLLKSRLVLLCGVFVLLHLLLAVVFQGDMNALVAGLMIDLRFIAMFVLMHVLLLLRPNALNRMVKVAAAAALIVISFGLLQITVLPDNVLSRLGYSADTITPFTTIDRNPDFVRINSTLRGPNPLGALMVIYIMLASAYLLKRGARADVRIRVGVSISSVLSVGVLFASYSRSAYLALIASLVALAVGFKRPSNKVLAVGLSIIVLIGIGGVLLSSTDWYSNVVLHEDPESVVVSKSNDEHVASLLEGGSRVLRQPLGAGIGTTGSASLYDDDVSNNIIIENYYFFVAHESGWLGLGVFLVLFVGVLRALWRRRSNWLAIGLFSSGIGLGLIGLLLPVWVDETVALTWWGLAGAVVATSGIMENRHAKRKS